MSSRCCGQYGHGLILAHRPDGRVHCEDCAAVVFIVGEGGIVVGAGLHGVVPEPEPPLGVELGATAVIDDAFHRGPDGAKPLVVIEISRCDDRALCKEWLHCEFAEEGSWALRSDAAGDIAV